MSILYMDVSEIQNSIVMMKGENGSVRSTKQLFYVLLLPMYNECSIRPSSSSSLAASAAASLATTAVVKEWETGSSRAEYTIRL